MTIKCNFNVPFEEVTTEFLNYIFTKTKEEKNY